MKLLLIQPSHFQDNGKPLSLKFCIVSSLTLPYLAALTPQDIEVEILNDYFYPVDFDASADLIGITVQTHQAPRAYQISDEFRKRGKTVVLGGFHPSFFPTEALAHSDAVVTGEAEGVWTALLNDFRKGNLQRLYRGPLLPNLKGLPTPRYDLLIPTPRYLTPVQATRGCPFLCDFCYVTKFYGRTYRKRPISDVVKDVEIASQFNPPFPFRKRMIFFVDDNLTADRRYARDLFKALIPLKIHWVGQSNITIALNQDFLNLARESGCIFLYIGLESFDQRNLQESGKEFIRTHQFPELLKRIRRSGIGVYASMIFGFDHDDRHSLASSVDALISAQTKMVAFHILTPAVRSELEARLRMERRLIIQNHLKDKLSLYDGSHATFHPKNFSPEELEETFWIIYRKFYSTISIFKRAIPPARIPGVHNMAGGFIAYFFFNILARLRVARRIQPLVG